MNLDLKKAIDTICKENVTGKYRRIYRDGFHGE